jgi:hypothetical protein
MKARHVREAAGIWPFAAPALPVQSAISRHFAFFNSYGTQFPR